MDKSTWLRYEIIFESGETATWRCASEREAVAAAYEDADGDDVVSIRVLSEEESA